MKPREFERIFQLNDAIGDFLTEQIASECKTSQFFDKTVDTWVKKQEQTEQFNLAGTCIAPCQHFQTILAISHLHDDRIPDLLKGITCETYYAICIGEGMLRWLLKCQQKNLNIIPSTELTTLFLPLIRLPLENESIDLVITSHTGIYEQNEESKILFSEIYRILKPEGIAILDRCDKN
ncbi:class I SAM-dependent methyltransferase [Candidatus Gracilibacteria bacterium]|nr:class I SAM-dependent methyltransferase [Candidatus Gracilibacteria bacterium]NJP18397.1 class I SAM-dependent methyltransferase [Hydrococcus sp. CRU_1_1]